MRCPRLPGPLLVVVLAVVTTLPVVAGCSALELNRGIIGRKYARAGLHESFVELPAGRLHFHDGGRGREAVLLVHGFGFGALETWEHQVPYLAPRYRVVAPDLYGFGKSQARRPVETAADEADALVELLDHLRIARAHVVGVSFGGYVALQLALRHPGRVDRLVLVDAAGLRPTEREQRTISAHFFDEVDVARVLIPPDIDTLRHFLGRMFYRPRYLPDFVLREILVKEFWNQKELKQRIARRLLAPDGLLSPEALGQVRSPTLLVWGRHDPLLLPEIGRRMAAAIRGSHIEWLEESSHTGMIEEPWRFNRLVIAFLEGQR
jgi:pimeloyl-ACP methyl ester carboxylesterase